MEFYSSSWENRNVCKHLWKSDTVTFSGGKVKNYAINLKKAESENVIHVDPQQSENQVTGKVFYLRLLCKYRSL